MANDRDSKSTRADDESSGPQGPSVGDTIKKLVTAGVSAAFMTEESIRSFVSELKLPKETLNLLLQGASKSKEELMNRVSREVIHIISKIDFVKEASRFVEEHKFRITAEIEVMKKDPGQTLAESTHKAPGSSSPAAKVSAVDATSVTVKVSSGTKKAKPSES